MRSFSKTISPKVRTGKIWFSYREIMSYVPVIHLASTCVFIFGYARAFGYKIISLFSASDIFQISIRHVIQSYFIMLIPFAVIFLRKDEILPDFRVKNHLKTLSTLCIFIVTFLILLKAKYLFDYTTAVQISIAAILLLLVIEGFYLQRMQAVMIRKPETVLSACIFIVVFNFTVGIHVGLQDSSRTLNPGTKYLECVDAEGHTLGALYGQVAGKDFVYLPGTKGQYVIGEKLCARLVTKQVPDPS